MHADIAISGDGFPAYFDPSRPVTLYEQAADGFRMVGKPELAEIFLSGLEYLSAPGRRADSILDMNEAAGNVHGRFFASHKDLYSGIGAFIRQEKHFLLK